MKYVFIILLPLFFPGLLFAKNDGLSEKAISPEVRTEYINLIPDSRVVINTPSGKIYHTILVEKNGFIHQMLFNSKFEERGYRLWGERSYGGLIK